MDLAQYIEKNEQSFEMWVEYDGFELQVAYVAKDGLRRLIDASRIRRFDPRTHQATDDVDDKKLARNLAKLIRDWRGLTMGKMAELIPVKVDPDDMDRPVPYTAGNAEILVAQAYGLDRFLVDTVTDLQAFREAELAAEVKN